MFNLSERVVLVTGASRGIGKEISAAMAKAGATVILNSRSQENLSACVADLETSGLSVFAAAFDITKTDQVTNAIAEVEERYSRLDVLVNNVGLRDRRALFEFEVGAFEQLLYANLVAPFELSRIAARGMVSRRWGRIVNVTSVAGPLAAPGDAIYTATKGGLEALTRALAAELGSFGITVNAIAPGFVASERNRELVEKAEIADWLQTRTVLGRWGDPSEIAGPAVFLASDAASYVSGHVLVVDGGLMARL